MTVENGTYISDLNASYPASTDNRDEGDNHLRLIKSFVKASFPNVNGAVNFTPTEANRLVGLTGNIRTSTSTPIAGEMVLMKAVTVSGSPSAIDFVNGSGGVTLTTAYDEFLIVFSNIRHASSTNAKLRMGFSQDGGSTFAAGIVQGVMITAADATLASAGIGSVAYLPVTAEQANASATAAPGIGGFIRLTRPVGYDSSMDCIVDYRGWNSGAGRGGIVRAYADTTSNDIDGLRLYWDSGNFANTGTVKLYGRKA
jgi:hypothetical protein